MTRCERPAREQSAPCSDLSSRLERWRRTAVLSFAMLALAAAAQAQDAPRSDVEIAGGLQFSAYRGVSLPGWFVSAARPVGDRTAIVLEIADAPSRRLSPYYESENHFWTLLGGVEYVWRGQRVTPFLQVLAGAALPTSRTVHPPTMRSSSRLLATYGILQFGAGAEIPISKRLGVRFTANAFNVYTRDHPHSWFRFTAGAVVGIGSR